jgi:hypothetical protein
MAVILLFRGWIMKTKMLLVMAAAGLFLPLSANALNKCAIRGGIEYRQAACPEGTDLPISSGGFSVLDHSEFREQAAIGDERKAAKRAAAAERSAAIAERKESERARKERILNSLNRLQTQRKLGPVNTI